MPDLVVWASPQIVGVPVVFLETNYWRAIGSAQALIEKAAAMGQGWLKGIGSAQRLLRPQPA
jgi:hypothetical protein